MQAPDGKMRIADAADTKTLLRIIQIVRTTRAEPFKRWLAEVGTQRIEEIENPELAMERMRTLHEVVLSHARRQHVLSRVQLASHFFRLE